MGHGVAALLCGYRALEIVSVPLRFLQNQTHVLSSALIIPDG